MSEDPNKLVERVQQKRSAWCGFQSLLAWDSHTCVSRISPFHDTAVAVVHPPRHGGRSARTGLLEGHASLTRHILWQYAAVMYDTCLASPEGFVCAANSQACSLRSGASRLQGAGRACSRSRSNSQHGSLAVAS